MTACATCGHDNVPGTLFCEECGHDVTMVATRPRTAPEAPHPALRGTGDIAGSAPTPATVAERTYAREAGSAVAVHTPAEPEPTYKAEREPSPAIPTPTRVEEPDKRLARTEPVAAQSIATAYLVSETGRRLEVPVLDVVIVGREDMRSGIRPDVDLTLDGASAAGVSRRHCRLLHDAGTWRIEDLKSTNYTVLNGKALPSHVPTSLRDGDELRLGKLRLRFHTA